MKTIVIALLGLLTLGLSEELINGRLKRGSFRSNYPLTNNLQIGGVNVDAFAKSGADVQASRLYNSVIDGDPHYVQGNNYLTPIPYAKGTFRNLAQIDVSNANNLDKPVRELQESLPNQASPAIIPPVPPPATPVNAVAANVPAVGNSVFLGSGSLGVVDLGGGAYALGSGAIGYSERRSNPRRSYKAPLLPPVQAAPNLIPAAVSSPDSTQQIPIINYAEPLLSGSQLPVDQNGYEYLPPDRVGFGDPLPPRPVKTTSSYATSTAIQIQSVRSQ